jgi:hypothetical protein
VGAAISSISRLAYVLQGCCQVVANDFSARMCTCAQRTPEETNAAIVLLRGL